MRRAILKPSLAIITLFAAIAPASASEADCAAVRKSFDAVAGVQAYKQRIEIKSAGMSMEAVIIGDVIYMKPDGTKWMKIPLKNGGRKGMLDAIMAQSTISDCKTLGKETLAAQETTIFEYLMTPPKDMPGAGNAPARHKIWVSARDGLVRRLASEDVSAEMSYEEVSAPAL